jgi:DNA repair exonuclease SbcCD ATPase subunit
MVEFNRAVYEKALELFYQDYGDDAPTPEWDELMEGGYITRARQLLRSNGKKHIRSMELKYAKQEADYYARQVEQLQEQLEQKEKQIAQLQERIKFFSEQVDTLANARAKELNQKEIEQLKYRITQLETEKAKLQQQLANGPAPTASTAKVVSRKQSNISKIVKLAGIITAVVVFPPAAIIAPALLQKLSSNKKVVKLDKYEAEAQQMAAKAPASTPIGQQILKLSES